MTESDGMRGMVAGYGVPRSAVEEWLPVVGFDGRYEVSDLGRVRSVDRRQKGRVLRAWKGGDGYLTVCLYDGVRGHTTRVHRLVGTAFLGPLPEGLVTRHLDGDRMDGRLSNLRYGTESENMHDITRHGRSHTANRTHCPQGHEYGPENTKYVKVRGVFRHRACKKCLADDQRRRRARRKLERAQSSSAA